MTTDMIFRLIFFLAFLCMTIIRVYYQSINIREQSRFHFREDALSLIAGGITAIITLVFGAEYLFFPGTFDFAYALPFPEIVRWIGVFLLALGIAVLGTAHYHLGLSFSSFVGSKDKHTLVQSGPYRWIRHPIYLAFFLSYLGGGLVAGNWVLTFIPVVCYAVLAAIRMPKEEQILTELFGQEYIVYVQRTGRLLPRIRKGA